MDEKRQEKIDSLESTGPKAEWVKPEMGRLVAGAAEFGDVSNADSQPGFS